MTVFVDANVLIYSWVPGDYHEACVEILGAIARGEVDGRASTAVLEEIWHLELSGKAGDLEGLTERAYTVLTPLLPVTDEIFRRALAVEGDDLGANDRVHVGTCLVHEIGVIVSADSGFDGVKGIRRVNPLDERARRRLLAARR